MQRDPGIIGVRSLAAYVPAGRVGADEIAARTRGGWTAEAVRDKLGIEQLAVAGPDDGSQEMGAKAAGMCLNRAGMDPEEVDAIVCIGDELREYPMTTSGIYIQERIGARRAWAVDVMQKCSSFAAGVRFARALLLAEPGLRNVLVCGGYRNGDLIDYTNPRVSFMYNLAPGGGAMLLERGWRENAVVGTSLISDGALARHVVAVYGGTANPITQDNVHHARRCLDVVDQEGMRRLLAERSHANFLRVIREAVAQAGATQQDIAYLAILHMKRSAHEAILADLGLPPERSIYLAQYGHIGQFDQILSLELAQRQGLLAQGGLVVCVGAGIGYSWGAAAFQWGQVETNAALGEGRECPSMQSAVA
jgi:3-oxoacyl-[acyl-carrier-protein] synthase-3